MTSFNNDLCRCGDIVRFPIGNQSEIIYSKDTGKTRCLPSSVIGLLTSCRSFRTIQQHVESFSRETRLVAENPESFTNQLNDFLNDGFLFSKNRLIEKCHNHTEPENKVVPITSIGFPTRNRVKTLQRSVTSFIENTLKHRRSVDFVVVDRSEDLQTRLQYKHMLKDLSSQFHAKIYYAGLEEKERFAQRLISQGLPPEVVNFALFDPEKIGYGPGSNRNALLLDCAGKAILMTDDDTVCRLTHAPGSGKTLTFLSGQDPTELSFFSDAETMLNTIPFVDEDVLSIHEELLGKDLWSCIRASNSQVNLDPASAPFLNKIFSDSGTILTTQTGIVGDSGAGSPAGLLSLEGESRQKLLRTESDYRQAIINRLELRKAKFPTITNGSFCMTTSMGLDLSSLLPPFMPVHRNSDGIFGVTLRRCFERGFMAHLPSAMLHLPMEEKRSCSPDDIWSASVEYGMDEIVMQAVQLSNLEISQKNSQEVLKGLGKQLIDLGSCDWLNFSQTITIRMLKARELYIKHLQTLLKKYNEKPDFWALDINKRLEKIKSTLSQNINIDISKGIWIEKQRLIMKFGQLLDYWPEMIKCAKTLFSNGERLSKAV